MQQLTNGMMKQIFSSQKVGTQWKIDRLKIFSITLAFIET